jgi:hypothetical protein
MLKGVVEEFRQPRATQYMAAYGESSELQKVTVAIFKRFLDLAKANDQVGIIGLFPTCLDFRYYRKEGKFPYESLALELSAKGIPFFDVGTEIVKRNKLDSAEHLYIACDDHWNKSGNQFVAQIIGEVLQSHGLDVRNKPSDSQ